MQVFVVKKKSQRKYCSNIEKVTFKLEYLGLFFSLFNNDFTIHFI